MSFFILKVSNDFPPQSKAKLNFLPVLHDLAWSSTATALTSRLSTLPPGLHHALVLASFAATRQGQTCFRAFAPKLCLPFPPLQQPFSREPITLSFIFFKSLIEHQLPPSSFPLPSIPLPALFFSMKTTLLGILIFSVYLFIGCLFFNIYLGNLAAAGLSCSTWDLQSLLQHEGSFSF